MKALRLRLLGAQDYLPCWQSMREFTAARDASTSDEIWVLEHPSVYTLGMNGDPRHLLKPDHTPLINTDRGGQITWHGPGQLIAYTLIDTRRLNLGIRRLVHGLEQSVIEVLRSLGIRGAPRADAPGVYVGGAKIASVGLRISRGCSYHGLSLNVENELGHFAKINPCGYPSLPVTSLARLGVNATTEELAPAVAGSLMACLGFTINDLLDDDS